MNWWFTTKFIWAEFAWTSKKYTIQPKMLNLSVGNWSSKEQFQKTALFTITKPASVGWQISGPSFHISLANQLLSIGNYNRESVISYAYDIARTILTIWNCFLRKQSLNTIIKAIYSFAYLSYKNCDLFLIGVNLL